MDGLELLVDLHRSARRQGPGGDDETRLAIRLSGLGDASDVRIADIGCGSGASTLVLASEIDAIVTAVDFVPGFLAELETASERAGLRDRIRPLNASMEALPFQDGQLDAIWSEGAIYSMGFANGVRSWRRFLRPGGILAVSELTWLTNDRPPDLQDHWTREYPEVDTAARKLDVLEESGYAPIGYFVLPKHCWMDNYYTPMRGRFRAFLDRNANSAEAVALVEAEEAEISLYDRYSDYISYGFYIARRTSTL